MVDALSRRPHLLHISSVIVNEFKHLTKEYPSDEDFGKLWGDLSTPGGQTQGDYLLREGFLFFRSCLCIPRGSFREFLTSELHGGGLAGHFGYDKTYALVSDQFYWPRLRKDVHTIVDRCRICQINKGTKHQVGL